MNVEPPAACYTEPSNDPPSSGIGGGRLRGMSTKWESRIWRRPPSDASSNVFLNKVVRSVFRSEADWYKSKQKSFAWWVGSRALPTDMSARLKSAGLIFVDRYIGLAAVIGQTISSYRVAEWTVKEALKERELRDHVSVSAAVWGMDTRSVEAAVTERIACVSMPAQRAGYIVAYNAEGSPIGNGTFRISSNGRTMYLPGSSVLPDYRNRGVYRTLLQYRYNRAKDAGCDLLTVQA